LNYARISLFFAQKGASRPHKLSAVGPGIRPGRQARVNLRSACTALRHAGRAEAALYCSVL